MQAKVKNRRCVHNISVESGKIDIGERNVGLSQGFFNESVPPGAVSEFNNTLGMATAPGKDTGQNTRNFTPVCRIPARPR